MLLVSVIPVVCWAAALIYWDIRFRRLPDVLTVPAGIGALVYCLAYAPDGLWGLFWPLSYWISAAYSGGIGGGDIKLAFTLGPLAWLVSGVWGLLTAIALASIFTLLLARVYSAFSLQNQTHLRGFPHGPSMIVATIGTCAWVFME